MTLIFSGDKRRIPYLVSVQFYFGCMGEWGMRIWYIHYNTFRIRANKYLCISKHFSFLFSVAFADSRHTESLSQLRFLQPIGRSVNPKSPAAANCEILMNNRPEVWLYGILNIQFQHDLSMCVLFPVLG